MNMLVGPFMYRRGGSLRGTIYAVLAALLISSLGWLLSR